MTQQTAPSKSQLLEALQDSGHKVASRVRAMPDGELAKGAYENGWTRREVLAHVASIEWTYPRLIAVARGDVASPEKRPPDAPKTSGPPAGGINDYNQRQVDKLADASAADLLALFERNRAATIEAVEAADEALFSTPVRSAGGISGTLGTVLRLVAVEHVLGHLRDIEGA